MNLVDGDRQVDPGGGMKAVAQLLNAMGAARVIEEYALFGPIAQMRYTEAVATFGADVLVMDPSPERLDVLADIYRFCANQGYQPEGEAISVGAWPTQFIPVFSSLTTEALQQAETTTFEGVPLRVVSAVYLAVIALSVGRPKDLLRILALLDSNAVTSEQIGELASRHGLADQWHTFRGRFLDG